MRVKRMIPVKQVKFDRIPIDNKSFEYAKCIESGDIFPPIKVTKKKNGNYQICDGRHRLLAHRLVGRKNIFAKFSTEVNKYL